uniref:Uncharacterized protein n=1 Tax=Ditylenchus dipsaci TaxID=166011 RepID=A0A915EAF1_9BILA
MSTPTWAFFAGLDTRKPLHALARRSSTSRIEQIFPVYQGAPSTCLLTKSSINLSVERAKEKKNCNGEPRKTQIIIGGMRVEISLPEVTMVPIFTKIVEADFKLDNLHFEDREGAEAILTGLSEEPLTVSNYVVQQRIYNCLSWAAEKYEMQQNFSEQCKVEINFVITMTSTFRLFLLDTDKENGWGRVQGRVINFNQTSSTIRFVPTGGTGKYQRRRCDFPSKSYDLISIRDYEFAERNTQIASSSRFNPVQKAAIFAIVSGNHKKRRFFCMAALALEKRRL